MAKALGQFERVEVTDRAQWRYWLSANHEQTESVWVVTFKKGASQPRVPYDDLVEEALAFGWVDSLPRKLDAERTMLLMSPRKPGSNWSAVNKARIDKMTAAGLMHPAGLAKIEQAKADGSWSALDAVDRLEVPADLAAAFAERTGSAEAFAAFPPSTRRGILEWIGNAKRPETRAARIAETAEKAARGERANQWRGRG
ncbi:YdeI/OmpD-associated family protein [Brevundimonas bacteroides]|uniref:YdeI/OmpD-associated family protein n=1 Tax=Brevundimonas bacteroides TaxID=74311 RepID=UPI000496613E|nr:YdeI/OmpD-associated family protein [Brevundimonas bacteroides]